MTAFERALATPEMIEVFGAAPLVQALLDVEAARAHAEGAEGVIPERAAVGGAVAEIGSSLGQGRSACARAGLVAAGGRGGRHAGGAGAVASSQEPRLVAATPSSDRAALFDVDAAAQCAGRLVQPQIDARRRPAGALSSSPG